MVEVSKRLTVKLQEIICPYILRREKKIVFAAMAAVDNATGDVVGQNTPSKKKITHLTGKSPLMKGQGTRTGEKGRDVERGDDGDEYADGDECDEEDEREQQKRDVREKKKNRMALLNLTAHKNDFIVWVPLSPTQEDLYRQFCRSDAANKVYVLFPSPSSCSSHIYLSAYTTIYRV